MRQVYRIDLSRSYHLRGSVRTAEGVSEGKLVDISATGTALVFLIGVDPRLAAGQKVELVFAASGGIAELPVPATVRSRAKSKRFVRYGFEFGELDFESIPYPLRPIFNRRRAPRVRPEETCTVEIAAVGDEHEELHGTLVDVSTSGLSVEIPFHAVERFGEGERVRVALDLPADGGTRHLELVACVRDRRLAGPAVHLGCELDAEQTPSFAEAEEAIADFVANREVDPGLVTE